MKRKIDVKKITYNVFGTLTDFLLWYTFLVGSSVGKTGPRGVYQTFREADETLQKVNHQTLATAWYKLVKRGFVQQKKRGNLYHAEITKFGKTLLYQKIPTYHKNRPWDHRIYLITYDIPEKEHKKRDLLRIFLKKIHCKRFQESVWITPYYPRQLINEFIHKTEIQGTIIVSDMGKDGGIGESKVQDHIIELYELEKLNNRYEELIRNFKNKKISYQSVIFEYLSILCDDPQLPFKLLPVGWLGDRAYRLYEEIIEKYILSFRGREYNRI